MQVIARLRASLLLAGMSCAVVVLVACERRLDRVQRSSQISSHGIDVLVQLYSIAHYGSERQAVFWCRSPLTAGLKSQAEAKSQGLKIDSDGWLVLLIAYVGPASSEPASPPPDALPLDRIQIGNSQFVYVDMGLGSVAISFDACRSRVFLSPVELQRLFARGEVVRDLPAPRPPAFADYKLSRDGSALCLRLSPAYLSSLDKPFDICTRDQGKIWYARASKGDLAVPASDDEVHSSTQGKAASGAPLDSHLAGIKP